MKERLYFAYGSNMNLDQMRERCPAARVVENVRLEDYRLSFAGAGFATVVLEQGSHVDGVLWKITQDCEKRLDYYEGYPRHYGKEMITVKNAAGEPMEVAVYIMAEPQGKMPARPKDWYLAGILEGCHQNGIDSRDIMEAVKRTRSEEMALKQENKKPMHERWIR
ncbi:gamma-glutamylcyclotransferase family protein [Hespellia stercorisuis]|uniref:Uncharacterized conserved protein YtfP, gamma-glutamylcyclotransferase (GGCT)/AIG2-like family n=1 Tax=Hespellia stercorisuis DSM 15480 TaxID=1121950 RepID=A0A1M6TB58_9FIRM|nr:gamma-glutamylcyclotransferase family protein [Hespellia stercorisuis]SHK54200.1 Uncharacterized conserved protein YtfP, gamma-glutamylcyclotransferase (GGCT)/AIG2-like family [Hespellia stercorisuis DSM 15480]